MRKPENKAPKGTVKKVLALLSRYRGRLLLSLLFAALNVAFTLAIPLLFGQAVDLIAGPDSVDLPGVLGKLAVCLILIALCALAAWAMARINNAVTCNTVRDLRDRAFAKINVLPFSYLDSHPTGETLSRVVNDADQFAEGLLLGFSQFFTGVLTIGGTLLLLIRLHPLIAAAVALLTPLSLFAARFIARRSYRYFRARTGLRAEQTAQIEEITGNLKTVRAFGRSKAEQKTFDEGNDRLAGATLKAIFVSSVTNPATRFVNALVYAAVALAGAFCVLGKFGGGLTVGMLATALSFANQYTKPFNEISAVFAELQNSLCCAARVLELIDAPAETPDPPDAVVPANVEGRMELKDVSFSYDKSKTLLEHVNVSVRPGQTVAIVGPTGCGKTTLINLLMRFYDPDAGEICLDGNEIRTLTRAGLRAACGMVLQETWLKNATVRDNICMGKPDATEEEMIAAAKKAHAHAFISRLPQGYDTVLGEEGGALSQGQKQLLCITRVMLSAPPILLLDEATSSIDLRTEIRVQKAFARLMENRTCFVVAHRLSTIMHADLILVMNEGNIVEQGTHAELLEKGGFYAELWNSQFA